MSAVRPVCDTYLRFRIQLERATTLDVFEYSCWVHAHREPLREGFKRSGEIDSAVYARMQFSRAIGLGV